MTHDVVLHSVRGPDEEAEAADEQGALLLHEGVRPREEKVGRGSARRNNIMIFYILFSGPHFRTALSADVFEYYVSAIKKFHKLKPGRQKESTHAKSKDLPELCTNSS